MIQLNQVELLNLAIGVLSVLAFIFTITTRMRNRGENLRLDREQAIRIANSRFETSRLNTKHVAAGSDTYETARSV